MLSIDEARNRVDRRLEPLADGEHVIEDAVLFCAGTDVHGPDLVEELKRSRDDGLLYIGMGQPPVAVLNGMMNRIFWLGFEYGKEES